MTTKTSNFRSRTIITSYLVAAVTALVFANACSDDGGNIGPGSGTTTATTATSAETGSTTATTTTTDGTTGGNSGTGGMGNVGTGGGSSTGGAIDTVECQGTLPVADVTAAQHAITVDPGAPWGPLPHFWNSLGTGHLGLYLREEDPFGNLGSVLKEHTTDGVQNLGMERIRSHGMFHDDIGIYSEDSGGNPVYNFEKSDQIFDFLTGQGIVPIIELGPMPAALASDPSLTVFDWGLGISPPKDYAKWEGLVREFAQHSLDRYGMDVVSKWDWEVWNEPECCNGKFWAGGMEGYFQLYDSSVAGVHAVLPSARVGGPVTSQPSLLPDAGAQFLAHVKSSNQHLGFFAYHSWSFVEGSVGGYFQALDLLDQNGYSDVQIAVTEFGPTWEFGLYDEPADMDQGAAFAVQTYSDLSRRIAQDGKRWPISFSWWVLSDVFEEVMADYRNDEPFIGCMGLISRQGIKKPAYNAYHFLDQMGDEQVSLTVEGTNVGGMASRDTSGGIQVIVYNGQNPGRGPADDQYYDDTEAHDISITLNGLNPEVAYNVTMYRVDDTHGNAYEVWQDMGRPKMDAMTDADWQALRDAMVSPAEPIGQALCGSSFSQMVSLPSPGVAFLTLTPAVP